MRLIIEPMRITTSPQEANAVAEKRFEVDLPEEVLASFSWTEGEVPHKVREALIMELLRLDRLSEAEAAKFLKLNRWELLIDGRRGRKFTEQRGLEFFGNLRILAEAKRLGLIDQAKPLLEAMLAAEYWIDEELIPLFLQEVGEAP